MAHIETIEQLIAVLQRQAERTPGALVGIMAPDETYWTIEHPLTADADGVFIKVDQLWATASEPEAQRFTADTTTGYDAADLTALNTAFNEVCRVGDLPTVSDELTVASLLEHIAASILMAYDAGARGETLVTLCCQGNIAP